MRKLITAIPFAIFSLALSLSATAAERVGLAAQLDELARCDGSGMQEPAVPRPLNVDDLGRGRMRGSEQGGGENEQAHGGSFAGWKIRAGTRCRGRTAVTAIGYSLRASLRHALPVGATVIVPTMPPW